MDEPVKRKTGEATAGAGLAVACFLLVLLFLAVSLTPLTNNDIWLHMATGKRILETGHVPLHDPFSFSAAGQRFYAHEWLSGVFFRLTYLVGGVNGLILLKTALGGVAMFLCAWMARRQGAGWTSTLGCTWLALVIVNSRFLERPEMFSYALTGVYVWVLTVEHQRIAKEKNGALLSTILRPASLVRHSLLWLLVPVQWIWVQLHGYFLTGLGLLGLFILGEFLGRLLERTRSGSPLTPRIASGGMAVAVMLLAGLVNPNTWEIYTFPFELAGGQNIFMATIFEWQPTFTTVSMIRSSMFLAFCVWLGLLFVGCLDVKSALARHGVWRGVSLAGLAVLLIQRLSMTRGDGLLPSTSWLWSPADLLWTVTGYHFLSSAIDTLLAPLRLAGDFGDDIFTLLWLALAGWTLICWRKPAAAGLAVLVAVLTLLLHHAGELAGVLLVLTILPALLWATWRRVIPGWQTLVTFAFLLLAVKQNRNIVNFALVTLPVLAPALTRLSRALASVQPLPGGRTFLPLGSPRLSRALTYGLLSFLFASLTWITATAGWPYTPTVSKKIGLGIGGRTPVQAVEYIRANGIKGRVFNMYSYGAYLIHELFPDTRVYMDSRNDVYGEKLYRTYLQSLSESAVTGRVFQNNNFDYVLVDYDFYPRRSSETGLFSYLRNNPEWVLVYFDDTALLYVRNRPDNAALIVRDGYRTLDPVTYQPGFLTRQTPEAARRYLQESVRALQSNPGSTATRLIRVEALHATGKIPEALALLEEVLQDKPDHIYALVTAAAMARDLDRVQQSLALYRRAHRLRPDLEDLKKEMERLEKRISG